MIFTSRPQRRVRQANARPHHDENPAGETGSPGADQPSGKRPTTAEQTLWTALCNAPAEGIGVGDLMRITGMTRPTIYRHLREYVKAGCVVQVSRGLWRVRTTEEPSP